jgi:hypothetical protein
MKKLVICLLAAGCCSVSAEEGFKSIFDGTLNGWKCPKMSYWTIEDGAITATSSDENPCKKNQFLVWQNGDLEDFELKLKFRISGSKSANSGIQIRSAINDKDGHAVGYQADMDRSGNWLGALYDEHTGRKALAKRGQKTVIDKDGKRTTTPVGDAGKLMSAFNKDGWNDYHITAKGSHIILRVNGNVTAEVIDDETAHQDLKGKLALQIHSGPPMKVQFKDIQLKVLSK